MSNLFVNYQDFLKLRKDYPIGVFLDATKMGEDDFDKFMSKYFQGSLKNQNRISRFIIKIPYIKDMKDKYPISADIKYIFSNECEYIEDNSQLARDLRKVTIGAKACSTGMDLMRYKDAGIQNVFITSPLLNDTPRLKRMREDGWVFYSTPNRREENSLDIEWIRPEGIYLYRDIIDGFVLTGDGLNINSVVSAYRIEKWLGSVSDYVAGFDKEDNPYKNQPNFFSPTFDIERSTCGDNTNNIETIRREYKLSQELSKEE